MDEPVTEFCQQNTGCHIRNHMLFCGKGRNTYSQCHTKNEQSVGLWKLLLSTDSHIAQPADQTMDWWEQIIRCIEPVEKVKKKIPETMLINQRTNVSCWESQKKDKAYRFCEKICTQKSVCMFFFHPAAQNILAWPVNETENIDGQCPGDNRNKRIHSCC